MINKLLAVSVLMERVKLPPFSLKTQSIINSVVDYCVTMN